MHSEPAAGVRPQSVGSLRFLTVLLVRAAPLYPGEPSDYRPMGDRLAVIRSPLVQASPNLGGWPLPLERFEVLNRGFTRVAARTVAVAGLRWANYSAPPPASLHVS